MYVCYLRAFVSHMLEFSVLVTISCVPRLAGLSIGFSRLLGAVWVSAVSRCRGELCGMSAGFQQARNPTPGRARNHAACAVLVHASRRFVHHGRCRLCPRFKSRSPSRRGLPRLASSALFSIYTRVGSRRTTSNYKLVMSSKHCFCGSSRQSFCLDVVPHVRVLRSSMAFEDLGCFGVFKSSETKCRDRNGPNSETY